MRFRHLRALLVFLALSGCAARLGAQHRLPAVRFPGTMNRTATVDERVVQYEEAVRARLAPDFKRIGISCPPRKISLIGLKSERRLEVWVAGEDGVRKLLRTYPVLGMSGMLGPKLREGDLQVPEGLYRVTFLNPNSAFHLSLRLDYPNVFDRQRGAEDGRRNLGSDIMIHGNTCSIGCLAMGDEAAEDLFVLAAWTGVSNVSVILSPVDFRKGGLPADMPPVPTWTVGLYNTIRTELARLDPPAPGKRRQ